MHDVNKRLREASRCGSEFELTALLLRADCNALARDVDDWTALMHAADNGHEACVRILLPVSDALARGEGGLTALMHATQKGHKECVEFLLPVSDALAEDKHGMTASAWAIKVGHVSLAQLIDAYALAQSDRSAIEAVACTGAVRGRAALRA